MKRFILCHLENGRGLSEKNHAAFQDMHGKKILKIGPNVLFKKIYQMRKYLFTDRSTSLAILLLSVLSGTLDIK